MTYVDGGDFWRELLVPGKAYDAINRFVDKFRPIGGVGKIEAQESPVALVLKPVEERLRYIQEAISNVSMHLPEGFAMGLNRQFANLMDEDAWENDDDLIGSKALTTFILTLRSSGTKKRPGIGTNGRGSITASWTEGENRLTVECLPTGDVSIVLARKGVNEEIERAAFGPIRPKRIREVISPFGPEIWFGN